VDEALLGREIGIEDAIVTDTGRTLCKFLVSSFLLYVILGLLGKDC
jgi:hypothetical protein